MGISGLCVRVCSVSCTVQYLIMIQVLFWLCKVVTCVFCCASSWSTWTVKQHPSSWWKVDSVQSHAPVYVPCLLRLGTAGICVIIYQLSHLLPICCLFFCLFYPVLLSPHVLSVFFLDLCQVWYGVVLSSYHCISLSQVGVYSLKSEYYHSLALLPPILPSVASPKPTLPPCTVSVFCCFFFLDLCQVWYSVVLSSYHCISLSQVRVYFLKSGYYHPSTVLCKAQSSFTKGGSLLRTASWTQTEE